MIDTLLHLIEDRTMNLTLSPNIRMAELAHKLDRVGLRIVNRPEGGEIQRKPASVVAIRTPERQGDGKGAA